MNNLYTKMAAAVVVLALTIPTMAEPTGSNGGTGSSGGSSDTDIAVGAAVAVGAGLLYWKYGPRQTAMGSQVATPAKRKVARRSEGTLHRHPANKLTKSVTHRHKYKNIRHTHRYGRK